MRYIKILILLLVSSVSFSQTTQFLGAPNVKVQNRGDFQVDSIFYVPRTIVSSRIPTQSGALRYQSSDSTLYQWTGTSWRKVAISVDDTSSMLSAYVRGTGTDLTFPIWSNQSRTLRNSLLTMSSSDATNPTFLFGNTSVQANVLSIRHNVGSGQGTINFSSGFSIFGGNFGTVSPATITYAGDGFRLRDGGNKFYINFPAASASGATAIQMSNLIVNPAPVSIPYALGVNGVAYFGTLGTVDTVSRILNYGRTRLFRVDSSSTPNNMLFIGPDNIVRRAAPPIFNYGSFSDTTTQSINTANAEQAINFGVTEDTLGVFVSNSSRINVRRAGTYFVSFSAQVSKTDAGTDDIVLWIKRNGNNVTRTSSKVQLAGNGAKELTTVTYVFTLAANDYIECFMQSPDEDSEISYTAASGNMPSAPSIILTINQIR